MAVVSDAWPELPDLHAGLGIHEFFEAYAISAELGCIKPDPRMYHHASAALGLAPGQCLFIDDDPALVTAAIQLGYAGRAMCRGLATLVPQRGRRSFDLLACGTAAAVPTKKPMTARRAQAALLRLGDAQPAQISEAPDVVRGAVLVEMGPPPGHHRPGGFADDRGSRLPSSSSISRTRTRSATRTV
jgi:beta-phosphoglucomutase-like phosphatase (HAD superfamily)